MSPRPGPAKLTTAIRLPPMTRRRLDTLAVEAGVTQDNGGPNRSVYIERLIEAEWARQNGEQS